MNTSSSRVEIIRTQRHYLLKLPRSEPDLAFLRALPGARWDRAAFCWVVPAGKETQQKLEAYFGKRLDWKGRETNAGSPAPATADRLVKIVRYHNGRLRLAFRYNDALVYLIRSFPLAVWEAETRTWSLPHTETILHDIKAFCEREAWTWEYQDDCKETKVRPKKGPEEIPNYRKVPEVYHEKLVVLRYSKNTQKVYESCFEEFINYYHWKTPGEISDQEIQAYLRYLIEERGISTSYQNQAINAIKFYYEKVLGGARKVYYIERPRQEKTLPVVCSLEEIERILKATNNLKHRAMLMTAYSAGLRVGELLNLRPVDIDSERMLINVRGGKGKKDRVTLLSDNLLKTLREYYRDYRPGEFLFTGQMGGRYSARSIQNVLKRSCELAKVSKRVTMHTLRHSFATHLLESGVSLRYIQSLLGHASPKTTEIYTHVTMRGMGQLRNPLDDMDLS